MFKGGRGGGGGLEKYLGAKNLNPFIPMDLVLERFVSFRLPEVEGLETQAKGLTADLAIDICRGFVAALEAAYLTLSMLHCSLVSTGITWEVRSRPDYGSSATRSTNRKGILSNGLTERGNSHDHR